jgi:hypothetical protein
MKPCALCDALHHLESIDDDAADAIVTTSDMSGWCRAHLRAWLATRTRALRGRARLDEILRRCGRPP